MGRTGTIIRTDFDAAQLRLLAGHSRDANQARRLLSLAAIYDGMNRKDAAMVGGMDRQTLRDWVLRFNHLLQRFDLLGKYKTEEDKNGSTRS